MAFEDLLITETKWRPWCNRLRVTNCTCVQTLAKKWQLFFNWLFQNFPFLLAWVCLKRFEFFWIIHDFKMLATWWCLWCYKKCLWWNKRYLVPEHSHCIQFGSIYGLCMHKQVIIVDIYKSFFEYIKVFFFLWKMIIDVTFLSLE